MTPDFLARAAQTFGLSGGARPARPAYLTVPQLAETLQIGRSLAYQHARRHGLRVGRLIRVPASALDVIRKEIQ